MTVIDLERGAPVSSPEAPLSIALGSFDGVHVGHRAIIARVFGIEGTLPAVWTFERNPFGVGYITSLDEKLRLFAQAGVRYAVVCPFDDIAGFSPEEFVDLLYKTGVRNTVCGFNFRFGRDRAGDPETLKKLCAVRGISSCSVDGVTDPGGEYVSSTRIRKYLRDGEIERANGLLGRPYSFTGTVEHGNEIGRKMGFPTANLGFPADRAPLRRGVYVTRCLGLPSVTNVGVRPTVTDSGELVCETHIIGCSDDLYGKSITVEFISYLRDERRFDSLDDLTAQLRLDKRAAQSALTE